MEFFLERNIEAPKFIRFLLSSASKAENDFCDLFFYINY